MREVKPDDKWGGIGDAQELLSTQNPSETDMVIVTLLLRLYDIQMAQLTLESPEFADKVFDAHNNGQHFHPRMFMVKMEEDDATDTTSDSNQ